MGLSWNKSCFLLYLFYVVCFKRKSNHRKSNHRNKKKQTHGEIVLLLLCDSVLTLENDHEIAIWGKETLFISLWKNWLNTNEQSIPLINYMIIQHILNVLWAVLKSEKGCPRMLKELLRTRNQYLQTAANFLEGLQDHDFELEKDLVLMC